jgi:hypothetical protein
MPTVESMSRRADPERIHQARRAAICNGLTDYGMPLDHAASVGPDRLAA